MDQPVYSGVTEWAGGCAPTSKKRRHTEPDPAMMELVQPVRPMVFRRVVRHAVRPYTFGMQ